MFSRFVENISSDASCKINQSPVPASLLLELQHNWNDICFQNSFLYNKLMNEIMNLKDFFCGKVAGV